MSMYTLERQETNRGSTHWRERPALYRSADEALEAAARLWDDDEVLVEAIRLKRTEVLCTLMAPQIGEAEE